PAEIRDHAQPAPGQTPTMEDAFISIVEESREGGGANGKREQTRRQGEAETRRGGDKETGGSFPSLHLSPSPPLHVSPSPDPSRYRAKARRIRALVAKEFRQILR